MPTELWVVGGERRPAAEDNTFAVIEAGTGAPMAQVAEAGPEDARRAVDVAVRAFDEGAWPRTSATLRGRVLLRASAMVRDRLEDLAELEARNVGKPIRDARDEIGIVADTLVEAGLPPEAISVLPGPGSAVGNALVSDPRVNKVGFTGSTEVGSKIMALAARNITRVSLELGGKSANVVFADADMDTAVERSVWSVFGNTGQDCCARSRVFVERTAYDDFVAAMAKRTHELKGGPPLDEETDPRPMISAGARGT